MLVKIKLYLLAHPDVLNDHTRWIVGVGWDQTKWPGREFPTAVCVAVLHLQHFLIGIAKDDLDREPLLRGRLVLLVRVDFHAYWASNSILSKLTDLPDIVNGGIIVRHEDGKPTGLSSPSRSIRSEAAQNGVFIRLLNRHLRRQSNESDRQLEACAN